MNNLKTYLDDLKTMNCFARDTFKKLLMANEKEHQSINLLPDYNWDSGGTGFDCYTLPVILIGGVFRIKG